MKSWNKLLKTMQRLRGPKGCPWDRSQTHESIQKNLLEETQEVIEAIEAKSPVMLKEELGDVLLQVVFHAQIASENGQFTINDVLDELRKKLIRRHPHVFGDKKASTPEEALKHWQEAKQKEKKFLKIQHPNMVKNTNE